MSEIIRTLNGKIVVNNTGNCFKQNYQFGNCMNYVGQSNIAVRIPNLNLTTWTLVFYMKLAGAPIGDTGCFGIGFSDGNIFGASLFADGSSTLYPFSLSGNVGTFSGNAVHTYIVQDTGYSNHMFEISVNGSNSTMLVKLDGVVIGTFDGITTTASLNNILIGATNRNGQSGTHVKFSNILVYNRVLNSNESSSLYNNKSSNEPYNKLGLLSQIKINQAEVLDFSSAQDGSDIRVGFRNLTDSYHHADLTNIPAASTLQAKADYINSGFIQSFI